jgi:hypothetical protein
MNVTSKVVFIKLQGCGPCKAFQDSGVWDKLKNDSSLASKVAFSTHEVSRSANGTLVAAERAYVDVAIKSGGFPCFYIHDINNISKGMIYGKNPRTYEAMKSWILANLTSGSAAQFPSIFRQTSQQMTDIKSKSTDLDKYVAVRAAHRVMMAKNATNHQNIKKDINASSTTNSQSVPTVKIEQKTYPSVQNSPGTAPSHAQSNASDPKYNNPLATPKANSNPIPTPAIHKIVPETAVIQKALPAVVTTPANISNPAALNPNTSSISTIENTSKGIGTSSSEPTFHPNNFPSSLYEKNTKRPPKGDGRPFQPLYASSPNMLGTIEKKSPINFSFKAPRH